MMDAPWIAKFAVHTKRTKTPRTRRLRDVHPEENEQLEPTEEGSPGQTNLAKNSLPLQPTRLKLLLTPQVGYSAYRLDDPYVRKASSETLNAGCGRAGTGEAELLQATQPRKKLNPASVIVSSLMLSTRRFVSVLSGSKPRSVRQDATR